MIELQEKWEIYGNHNQALEERAACAGNTEDKSSSAYNKEGQVEQGKTVQGCDSLQRPGSEELGQNSGLGL